MGKITLAGAIPGDNNDGLGPHSTEMLDDYKPGDKPRIYNVLARIYIDKITTKTLTGDTYPILRITHWELVSPEDQAAFGEMIGNAFGVRTGAQELPFPDDAVPLKDAFPEETPAGDDEDDGDGDDLSQRRAVAR